MSYLIKWLMLCLTLLLSACFSSLPTTFYLLQPISPEKKQQLESIEPALTVFLKPITFPEYLDRPQMVYRESDFQLRLNEYHRWAEPLKENFNQVLIADLNSRIAPGRVVSYAALGENEPDYQMTVNVSRLDVDADDQAKLQVYWSLLSGKNSDLLQSQRVTYTVPLRDDSYEAAVAAQSKAIAMFADELAKQLLRRIND